MVTIPAIAAWVAVVSGMSCIVLAGVQLVILHSVDGREVSLAPHQVTSLHARTKAPNKLVAEDVSCVVGLSDGKTVSVAESCEAVRRLLEGRP
jgi:hypothetical protein